ncbi:chloride channel protein, partial [Amycolatopsis sp. NPDC051114]|uniref:chloride channel protein n=1 Tax=Amycolatopsis sp. NPDC051114 TaxID=3155280 RepID=UPI003438959C
AAGLTLGAGGSAGAEAPIIHLAAALGSALARLASVPARPVAAAAVAGGISGSFEAPLTGVVLVLELLLDGVAGLEFTAVVAGSAAGALTAQVLPGAPVRLPGVTGTAEGTGIVLAGVLAALAGVVLTRSLEVARLVAAGRWPAGGCRAVSRRARRLSSVIGRRIRRPGVGRWLLVVRGGVAVVRGRWCVGRFGGSAGAWRSGVSRRRPVVHAEPSVARNRWLAERHPGLPWWRPAVGGLVAGPVVFAIPGIGGTGPDLFAGVTSGASGTLLLLAAGKIVTTSVTFAAGGVGGTIGPTLVVGAAVGAAVPVAGGAVAGMAACLAAAGRAPVTAVALAVELGGLDLLPAILPAAVLGRLVGGLFLRDTALGTGARVDRG